MSRQDEIDQGLREEGGALIGGLVVEDYIQGMSDYANRAPPPRLSSASYDLGRKRACEEREAELEVEGWLANDEARRDAAMREILKDEPELLAEHMAKMNEIRAGRNPNVP